MDEIDRANEHIEREMAVRLALAARRAHPIPLGMRCLNCDAAFELPKRWCDDACREDWELRERQKRK